MLPPTFAFNLVEGQTNVIAGVGEPGEQNAVAVAVRAQGFPERGVRFIAGTAVPGRPMLVATSLHSMLGNRIMLTGRVTGKVEVFAMSVADFSRLDQAGEDVKELSGCPAKAQHSWLEEKLADDMSLADVKEIPAGDDCAFLQLRGVLPGMHAEQPLIVTVQEALNLVDYLISDDVAESQVPVVLEGISRYLSQGESDGAGNTAVTWFTEQKPRCKTTGTQQANAGDIGYALEFALDSGKRPGKLGKKAARGLRGRLNLWGLWCPRGFSGGGAYVKVPAAGLDPDAAPGAEGNSPFLRMWVHIVDAISEFGDLNCIPLRIAPDMFSYALISTVSTSDISDL